MPFGHTVVVCIYLRKEEVEEIERGIVECCLNMTPNNLEVLDAENPKQMISGYVLNFELLVCGSLSGFTMGN